MRRHWLLLSALLSAALACYALGFAWGGLALIGIGVVLEATFWVRLLRGRRRNDSAPPSDRS